MAGFDIRNILNKNISINEVHLKKLEDIFKIKFRLKEIHFHPETNFGFLPTDVKKRFNCSAQLAEFVGIMLGDGNLDRNRVKISLDKRGTNYIRYVKHLFKALFGVELKQVNVLNTNQTHLHYYNNCLVNDLLKYGLKRGDKIRNKIRIPQWIKFNLNYSRSCIRGLIDTDGCIYFCKRERKIYIKFTNFNPFLLKDFSILTTALGYHFVKANKKNKALYRKDEVVRFIKEIKPLKSEGIWANLVKLRGLGLRDPGSNPGIPITPNK